MSLARSERVAAVVFDVGETLVDETNAWGRWADWLGVPRLTLFGVLGGVIERGEDHRRAFELVRPGIDLSAEVERQAAAGESFRFEPVDFYPDAGPTLNALRALGYRLGVAGNQPFETERILAELGVELDLIASSARWGIAKPDRRFFDRIAAELGLPTRAIAYVGDRVDNDVRPAAEAGMVAIHIRRGPWGILHARDDVPAPADASIGTLAELPEVLARL